MNTDRYTAGLNHCLEGNMSNNGKYEHDKYKQFVSAMPLGGEAWDDAQIVIKQFKGVSGAEMRDALCSRLKVATEIFTRAHSAECYRVIERLMCAIQQAQEFATAEFRAYDKNGPGLSSAAKLIGIE